MSKRPVSPTPVEVRKFIAECQRLWPGARLVPPTTNWRRIAAEAVRRLEQRLEDREAGR